MLEHINDSSNLSLGELLWLSSLLAHESRKLLLVFGVEINEFVHVFLSLLNWCLRPALECLQRRLDRIVNILLIGDWYIPQLLLGGGIDTIVNVLAADILAIDDIEEIRKGNVN